MRRVPQGDQEPVCLVESFDADRMHIVQEGFGKEDRVAAWRRSQMGEIDYRLWLVCDACHHAACPEPRTFAEEHQLTMTTSMLLILRRLRSKWGSRKCGCRREPFDNLKR